MTRFLHAPRWCGQASFDRAIAELAMPPLVLAALGAGAVLIAFARPMLRLIRG